MMKGGSEGMLGALSEKFDYWLKKQDRASAVTKLTILSGDSQLADNTLGLYYYSCSSITSTLTRREKYDDIPGEDDSNSFRGDPTLSKQLGS
jgi:hypothetical protein